MMAIRAFVPILAKQQHKRALKLFCTLFHGKLGFKLIKSNRYQTFFAELANFTQIAEFLKLQTCYDSQQPIFEPSLVSG